MNNGRPGIPPAQVAAYKCRTCGDNVFRPIQCLQFFYDRLKPEDMKPMQVTMYQCLSCDGYLMRDKTGMFVTVHREETPRDGDEWKTPPSSEVES